MIPKAGHHLTLAQMVAFLKGQVADYKLPEVLVEVGELLMTPTGKRVGTC